MGRSNRQLAVLFAILLAANSLATDAKAQTSGNQAKLYFFTNAACGPCRMVEPELEKLFREGYPVMKIDTSMHPDWTQRFQVAKTPTVIMVQGNKEIGRKSGYVDAATMRQWFKAVEAVKNQTNPAAINKVTPSTQLVRTQPVPQSDTRTKVTPSTQLVRTQPVPQSDTRTKGTYKPENDIERLAMQATVRLKIDDPQGSSYATGTVIHSFEGESLVLTCGHVFRDSGGKGTISAEYGFTAAQTKTATGELLFYDADDRDIGLVAIRTSEKIDPVTVAKASYPVQKGDQIFSVGCDHGEQPSIRRSRVKNQSKWNGVNKYEIYGRPVNGRSGGGMFTSGGQLVGVCNAAVVDVDEGIYVALDTIHWQIDKVKLAHLFDNDASTAIANTGSNPTRPIAADSRMAAISSRPERNRRDLNSIPIRASDSNHPVRQLADANAVAATNVVNSNSDNQTELILVLRNKNAPGPSESWTVTNPSSDLIDNLKGLSRSTVHKDSSRNRLARLRRDMPNLQTARGNNYNSVQMRAQSPR